MVGSMKSWELKSSRSYLAGSLLQLGKGDDVLVSRDQLFQAQRASRLREAVAQTFSFGSR